MFEILQKSFVSDVVSAMFDLNAVGGGLQKFSGFRSYVSYQANGGLQGF